MPDYKDTSDRRLYQFAGGKAQMLLCRTKEPKPDFSWTLKKIRKETGNPDQLGFTDVQFESETVSIPKAEDAGYFSGRAAMKTVAIRIPKELDVTDAQVKAAEARKDGAATKRLKALQACRDHVVTHELKHVEKDWDSLSEMTLGWQTKLGSLTKDSTVTQKHIEDAVDGGPATATPKMTATATKWDGDDLGPLRTRMRAEHIFVKSGEDATFDYVEPAGGG